jgi:hypothetical protein
MLDWSTRGRAIGGLAAKCGVLDWSTRGRAIGGLAAKCGELVNQGSYRWAAEPERVTVIYNFFSFRFVPFSFINEIRFVPCSFINEINEIGTVPFSLGIVPFVKKRKTKKQ